MFLTFARPHHPQYVDQDDILMDLQQHVMTLYGAVAHMRADPTGDWLSHFADLSDDELMALATVIWRPCQEAASRPALAVAVAVALDYSAPPPRHRR